MEGNGPFFLLNIINQFDSLVVAKSDVTLTSTEVVGDDGATRTVHWLHTHGAMPHFTLNTRAIAGRHLWRTDRLPLLSNIFYMSDELTRRKAAAKLKGFRFAYVDEVDEEWDPEANLKP